MRAAVLVVTHWFDPTADFVIEELSRRSVAVVRFDVADFPGNMTVTGVLGTDGWASALHVGGRSIRLEEVSGIYFRRPTAFEFGTMADGVQAWALAEARNGLGGLLMTSDRWLNHPHRGSYANYKPVQLAEACQAGLAVPRTIVTNDPSQARSFAEHVGEVIYKPMSPAVLPEGVASGTMLYASAVTTDHLADNYSVAATAHMFQERIRHDYAVRLTVVDDRMFAAAIHAHSEAAALDWRSDYEALTYDVIDVPPDIRRGVLALMRAFQLRFGAFDFLANRDGWTFLEINPNGQWAWIEQATRLPIAAAIADALTTEKPS